MVSHTRAAALLHGESQAATKRNIESGRVYIVYSQSKTLQVVVRKLTRWKAKETAGPCRKGRQRRAGTSRRFPPNQKVFLCMIAARPKARANFCWKQKEVLPSSQ
jgi:hypothetical protein